MNNEPPLPYGWIREWDSNHNHAFYVDTRADPPRAIWTHPYEDEQYLREHPEVREKLGPSRSADALPDQPSSSTPLPRRSSFPGESSSSRIERPKGERGFFGKLKDKAIGTKEEREAAKAEERRREEERRQRLLELQRQRLAYAQQHPQYGPYGGYQGGYQGGRNAYMPPQYGPPRRAGGGFGGAGLPLLGGLAGGLLLGEAIDGFDGGDFGGGDFGGGDFGGGDFGGGDFGGF